MSRNWKLSLGIIGGLLVVGIIIWLSPMGRFILSGGLSMEELPFDEQQWKTATHSDSTLRKRLLMLDDLMENKLEDGMDSASVKQMLGEPYRQYGFSYPVGTITPGIAPFYLILTFDSSGMLSDRSVKPEDRLKEE